MKSVKFLKTILTTAVAAQSLLITFTTTHSLADDDATAENVPIGSVLDFAVDTFIPSPLAESPDWGYATIGSDDSYSCILYGKKTLFTDNKPLLRIKAGSPKPIVSIMVYPTQDLVQYWLNAEKTIAVNCGRAARARDKRGVRYPTIKRVRELLKMGNVNLLDQIATTLDAKDI